MRSFRVRLFNKLIVFATLVTPLFQSCIGVSHIMSISGANESLLREIPKGSKIVIVEKPNASEDELYNEVYKILLSRGHRVQKDDPVRHFITTEGKDVGESTLQRMTIVVTAITNGAKLTINTEWKGGTDANIMATAVSGIPIYSTWAEAKWEVNRLGIAFSESVVIGSQIENGYLYYDLSENKLVLDQSIRVENDPAPAEEQPKQNLTSDKALLLSTDEEDIYTQGKCLKSKNFQKVNYNEALALLNKDGDYSLPSSYFLKYLSKNQNLKAMFPNGWYWSNEEESDENVLCVNIGTGEMKKMSKAEKAYFLPILLEEK